MYEVEIKQEIQNFDDQCRVCLSVGRKLSPLGEYTSVFRTLTADIGFQKYGNLDTVQLCWECAAVLRRVHIFVQRAHNAQQRIHAGEYAYGSLSNLTTIILNDTHAHTVYVYETSTHVDVKLGNTVMQSNAKQDHDQNEDIRKSLMISVDVSRDDGTNDVMLGDDGVHDDDDVKSEVMDVKGAADPKKPRSNHWATKRVLQNKKPKFKIITDITEDCFKQIQIEQEDVTSYLASERDGEYFKCKKYKCVSCVESFVDEKSLVAHNSTFHDKLSPYICDVCLARTSTKRTLSAHVHAHYVTYECTLCTYTCRDVTQRQLHHSKAHRRVFQCVKCELKFGSRKQFFAHYKEWHERYICHHCGVSFKMRYCIKNHLRKQHSPFECKPCNKRFARYNGLWLHNKTTHPPSTAATPAYCVECDRRYPDVYRYRWHLANSARHNRTEKIRVACPGCDKVFTKNIYMKDHYNLVHLKYYKYRCETCDKNFIRNADLVKHTRRVHEGILPPKNKICNMCGRGFSTNKILLNHVRTHTGERPFACATCGARFAQSTTLAAHTRALHAHAHAHDKRV